MTARTYPQGVTSWVDVEQPDADAAEAFYSGLLGWTFTRATPPEAPFRYSIAQLDGHDVAGLGSPPPGGRPGSPGWNTYVAVDDAEAAVAAVVAAGGTVLSSPAPAGEGGIAAAIADPSGVELCLWQARKRLGAQVTNVPGAWNFSDLWSGEPATAFYEDVFGWVVEPAWAASMIRVPGYGDHLASTVDPGIHERQAAVNAPPGFADAIGWAGPPQHGQPPQWHVTFAVADREATAAAAEQLGGTVLAADDTEWTRTALVRDPQGAVFTASQFTPPGADAG